MLLNKEESEAVKQVAKTASEYRDSVDALGGFVSSIVGYPLKQAGGLVGDALGVVRIELALKFKDRVERKMEERGMGGPKRPLPLSIAYPLLEAASLEEDETLSDMFAELLIRAVSEGETYIPNSFVDTIKRMSPFEALILQKMAGAPSYAVADSGMMYTGKLPDEYLQAPVPEHKVIVDPSKNTSLALATLISSGCVQPMGLMNGGWTLTQCRVTDYGIAFIEACNPEIRFSSKHQASR